MTPAGSTEIRDLVQKICAEMGLDDHDATVAQWVQSAPETWASCCLGGCDPCNDLIRAAAKRVLAALEAERP